MDNVTNTTETFRVEDLINLLLEKEKSVRYREEEPAPMTISQTEIYITIEMYQFVRYRDTDSKEVTIEIGIRNHNSLALNWSSGVPFDGGASKHMGIRCQNAAVALESLIPKLVASKKVNLLEKTEKLVKLEFVF